MPYCRLTTITTYDLETPEGNVFCGLNALTALRGTSPAFGTEADVWTLDTGDDFITTTPINATTRPGRGP